MGLRDPSLAEKLSEHRAHIATFSERTRLLERQIDRGGAILTTDLVERFGQLIRENLQYDNRPSGGSICACSSTR